MRIFRPAHRLALTSILAVLLGACGGGDGANGLNALTAVGPAGDRCEHGGSKIEAGVDADGNGSLGSNEVSSTHYACNGAGEPGATLNWVAQSEAVTAKSNTGYIATSTSTLVVTLPDKDHIAIGDVVRVIGEGAGGWKIAQTGAQEVKLASLVGASWTATGPHARWDGVDSSADGKILVAAAFDQGYIYISIDGGVTWTRQTSNWPTSKSDGVGEWAAVACSADCSRLVAAETDGTIYAAIRNTLDGSWTWTEMPGTPGAQNWWAVSSSDDGGTAAAVARGGDVYIWTDASGQWTPGNLPQDWLSVTVSGDGSTAVAVGHDEAFYIWKKDTGTWVKGGPADNTFGGDWESVTSSYDGIKLVAVEEGGYIHTSIDGGVTWVARESRRNWSTVASSADGIKLLAAEFDGRAYVSIDGGVTWAMAPGEPSRQWFAATISGDGTTMAGVECCGQIHVARAATTPGKDGYISGDAGEAIELIYLGNDRFGVLSHEGRLTIR